ncbi:MAG: STAS-like domain-containing protein [Deltaproteobacteria bacterium]|nr:STAS-like domain-containing protein [Deltaproteobacteria bacterium]
MTTYNLYKLLEEELKNDSSDLVTRPSGQAIRERIERDIAKEKRGEIIALDFSKIGIVDYSCADEVVAKLISRLWAGEYGDRYVVLTGLNENQKENIEVALERKDLAIIAEMQDKEKILVGTLNNYLKETLNLIIKKGRITAKELSDEMELESNTSGMRLLNLYKKRLVKRIDKVTDSGKVWIYENI